MENFRKGQVAVFVSDPDGFDSHFFAGIVKAVSASEITLEKPETGKTRKFPRDKVRDADKYFDELFTELVNEQAGEGI